MCIRKCHSICRRTTRKCLEMLLDDPVDLVILYDLEVFARVSILLCEEVPRSDASWNGSCCTCSHKFDIGGRGPGSINTIARCCSVPFNNITCYDSPSEGDNRDCCSNLRSCVRGNGNSSFDRSRISTLHRAECSWRCWCCLDTVCQHSLLQLETIEDRSGQSAILNPETNCISHCTNCTGN